MRAEQREEDVADALAVSPCRFCLIVKVNANAIAHTQNGYSRLRGANFYRGRNSLTARARKQRSAKQTKNANQSKWTKSHSVKLINCAEVNRFSSRPLRVSGECLIADQFPFGDCGDFQCAA